MSLPAPDLARIKDIERKARQGDFGAWRKEFVRRYRQELGGIYKEIREGARPYFDTPGGITCGKGCNTCCQHFISIPVSHAVVIADYLYASPKAMSAFLRGYERWRNAFGDNPDAAALLNSLEYYTTSSDEVATPPQELLSAYHTFAVPCPFLDGKSCAVYSVRPICCAAYFAVSSPALCEADSGMQATVFQITPSQANLRKLSQLADPRLSWHQEPMPELVYKLLTRGLPEVAEDVERLFAAEAARPDNREDHLEK